ELTSVQNRMEHRFDAGFWTTRVPVAYTLTSPGYAGSTRLRHGLNQTQKVGRSFTPRSSLPATVPAFTLKNLWIASCLFWRNILPRSITTTWQSAELLGRITGLSTLLTLTEASHA